MFLKELARIGDSSNSIMRCSIIPSTGMDLTYSVPGFSKYGHGNLCAFNNRVYCMVVIKKDSNDFMSWSASIKVEVRKDGLGTYKKGIEYNGRKINQTIRNSIKRGRNVLSMRL